MLLEGEPLFTPILENLWWNLPGDYEPWTMFILIPSDPDYYSDNYPTDWVPERREYIYAS